MSAFTAVRGGSPFSSSGIGSTVNGSATRRSASLRKRSRASYVSPAGTTVTGPSEAAPRAIRAAPDFSGMSRGSSCEIPSGKRARTPPRFSSARAAANVSRFLLTSASASCGRYTGIESNAFTKSETNGIEKRGDFARKATGRGERQRRRSGSISPFGWLRTRIVGPDAGIRSSPEASTRR